MYWKLVLGQAAHATSSVMVSSNMDELLRNGKLKQTKKH